MVQHFRTTRSLLTRAGRQLWGGGGGGELAAWHVLVKRAIAGSGDAPDSGGASEIYGGLKQSSRKEARAAVEDLMKELEQWSIRLQRHCPEDWNQCSAILLRCLDKEVTKKGFEPFQV